MRLITIAFILSIALHFLFYSSYKQFKQDKSEVIKTVKKEKNKSKVTYVKLLPKIKEIQKPKKVEKPKPKKLTKPKLTKVEKLKKIKKVKKTKAVKKIKVPKKTKNNIFKKPVKKQAKKPIPVKKVDIKPQKKRRTIPKKSLENFILDQPEPLNMEMLDEMTQKYLRLYGKEYNNLTKVQKVYLQKNLNSIVQITRSYFRFPRLALKLKKNDYNIVEFIFYPNGDISNLKIVQKGEYSFYDKAILEAIEIAYKDYPRPKKPTKIKFFITYQVY